MDFSNEGSLPEVQAPPAPPADGMTWAYLADNMRLYGNDFIPPPHLRGLSLSHVEARAREEGRAGREAREARESAARIAAAPKSIERALLDSPKQAVPARQGERSGGWRQRVRLINQLRRCGTYREAAARIGVDESTVRRWRHKFPKFAERCDEVIAQRHRQNEDDLKLRAGQPKVRPYFFRGKQIGEHVQHDDRALMFLLKLEDGQRARAEAREERRQERREQREHEIRLKEMEIAARRMEPRREPDREEPPEPGVRRRRLTVAEITEAHHRWEAAQAARETHASAAHRERPAGDGLAADSKGLSDVLPDIEPPQVVEVPGRPV